MKEYLATDEYFLVSAPEILAFNASVLKGESLSDVDKAVKLYLAVRDQIRYDPFEINLEFKRDHLLEVLCRKTGHCVDKASVLITCLRAEGIHARLGLAKVKNHIGTSKLETILGTNVLVPHGYTEVYLEDAWVKCTSAFNLELCEKLGVKPLDWNGRDHSQFQEYNSEGSNHMEYLEDYGCFATLPIDFIKSLMKAEYPSLFDRDEKWLGVR